MYSLFKPFASHRRRVLRKASPIALALTTLCQICIIAVITLPSAHECRSHRVRRIVGGMQAASPPPDDPVVFVRLYGRNARVEGTHDRQTGLYSFRGLRFAEPPLGLDRFMRPRFRHLRGDIDATEYGPPCPQPDLARGSDAVLGDEDCLRLNVYTPRLPDESSVGLPVVIFVHGGGFRYGSANQYGPDPLTSKNIVFVPIQYRLGTLGLIGDGSAEFGGNVALFDMAAAVRWVHEYVANFGGDPRQVSIIGHGSGATSAVQLAQSDAIDDGMISGVIAMSGSAYTKYSVDAEPEQSMRQIAEINQCGVVRRETDLLRCLRRVSAEDLVRRDSRVQSMRLTGTRMMRSMTGMAGFGPAVESPYADRSRPSIVERRAEDKLENRYRRRVAMLTGVTKHETGNCLALNEIRSVFNTATDFLGNLTEALDLGKMLNAGSVDGAGGHSTAENVDLLGVGKIISLTDYLKISPLLEPLKIVAKLTEVTTDALFNLPAVLSVQDWFGPAFLYSFEHFGGHKTKGSHFLAGLPIVSNRLDDGQQQEDRSEEHVAHGDELVYLFDVRDVFGNGVGEVMVNATDLEVRSEFTTLIADFVRTAAQQAEMPQTTDQASPFDGLPNIPSILPRLDTPTLFGEIKSGSTAFIRIGGDGQSKARTASDFRFCQLSLFGAKLQPVETESCAGLVDQLDAINSITSNLTGMLGVNGDGKGLLGGLGLAADTMKPKQPIRSMPPKQTESKASKKSWGILGIF